MNMVNLDSPIKVGLIGAGKFVSIFLSQVPTKPGINLVAVADLSPSNSKLVYHSVGWLEELIDQTRYTGDALFMMERYALNVVVEATGDPQAGIIHALSAKKKRVHIILANLEADVFAVVSLAEQARSAVVVYSMA